MQFSLLAVFAIATTAVSGGPLLRQNTCDIQDCILDLASTVVSCTSAVVAEEINLVADAQCIIAAVQDIRNLPAPCKGCIDFLEDKSERIIRSGLLVDVRLQLVCHHLHLKTLDSYRMPSAENEYCWLHLMPQHFADGH
ncbi:hypothetical protein C8F04DRAFT_1252951 [Mycena alexandri]|uniref:Fungal calcium binding protein domain-containing protein n=1 Tax=Mycena alexandri TaxID=1745969 RepID=A0AAD6XAT5_9AGAR|nr:hypothetical protein C8F04DRAFT_1252951 [Mycena alexandri]